MKASLLVIDDEIGIHKVIARSLRPLGFDVVGCALVEDAIPLLQHSRFDVVLLDINMPGMGGIAGCHAIRRTAPSLPILMLTVRNSVDDKVEALEAGADDYITKPFAIRELVARVRAAIRRGQSPALPKAPIAVGDVSLCSKERVFLKRGSPVPLTRTQFDILHLLISNQGRPVTHKMILTTIWGAEFRDHLEYLRTYVRELRKRIEDDPAHPEYLLTAPCVGYRFQTETESSREMRRGAAQ